MLFEKIRNGSRYKKQNIISKALLGSLFNLQILFFFQAYSAVRKVTGGKIFSFLKKCLIQLNLVTELNYSQFGLDFFSYPLVYIIIKAKYKIKHLRRQILLLMDINHSSAKRAFDYLQFLKMYILLNTGGIENLHSYSQVNVYIQTTMNLMFI